MATSPQVAELPIASILDAKRGVQHHPTGLGIACLTDTSIRFGPNRKGFDFQKVRAAASLLGYACEVFDLAQVPSASLERTLLEEGYHGLILGPRLPNAQELDLDWDAFSVVGLGKRDFLREFHHVTTSDYDSVCYLWEILVQRGYRRIGPALMSHEHPIIDDKLRESATEFCQTRFHPRQERIPAFLGDFKEVEPFHDWIHEHRPEVVIGFHTGIYYWLRDEFGMELPGEIGFATLHGASAHLRRKGIAGLESGQEEACRAAVELLDQQMRLGQRGMPRHPRRIVVDPYFIDGNSLLPDTAFHGNSRRTSWEADGPFGPADPSETFEDGIERRTWAHCG